MPGNCLYETIAGRMLPPVATSMPRRFLRSSAASAPYGGVAPAQITTITFLPGLSFIASTMRWMPAVKSEVACGRYSSWTILAFLSASLNALTPSRPNA